MCSRSFAIALTYKSILMLGLNYYREKKIMFYGAIHNILVNKGFLKLLLLFHRFTKLKKCHGIFLLQNFLLQVSFHLQILSLNYSYRI